jgi:hypothetical protein
MRLRCLIGRHEWVAGRAADRWARNFVKGKKSYHNRGCKHCPKEEWNADETEKEAERLLSLKKKLGSNQVQADAEPVDPCDLLCDPDEFP